MASKKVVMVCKYCKSPDIRKDADAVWDIQNQRWELNALLDNVTCEVCGGATNIAEGKPVEADQG